MEKREQQPESEDRIDKPDPPSKMRSSPREPELDPPTNPNSPPKTPPPPKSHSPSREPELEPTNPDPNPNTNSKLNLNANPPARALSPPLEPLRNLKPQPVPLYFPPEEEEEEEKQQQQDHHKQPPFKPQITSPAADPAPALAVNNKAAPTSQETDEERAHSNMGSGRKFLRPNLTILKRTKRENVVKRSLLGFRVCGLVFSLISFSVLAADRDRGWALDSFYRYKEFRYCMAVNVIAFAYCGFQAYDLAYQLTAGKRRVRQHLRYYLDFSVDQMLTYLLISSSSSAAVRVDDWQSNWGKDEFPEMAKASVAVSFLAFVSLAFSSLISGYALCTLKPM